MPHAEAFSDGENVHHVNVELNEERAVTDAKLHRVSVRVSLSEDVERHSVRSEESNDCSRTDPILR